MHRQEVPVKPEAMTHNFGVKEALKKSHRPTPDHREAPKSLLEEPSHKASTGSACTPPAARAHACTGQPCQAP